jgi:hypothetical protein
MDRNAWIMAASLLDRHGVEAAAVVCAQLATLHRLVELEARAEDIALLGFWRQTAQALLTIVEAEPAGPHSLH